MTTSTNVDIVMIGHFAKDQLVVDGRSEVASGGAVYYGSVALRRMGVSVAIVTRLHPDDFSRLEELKQEGVQVFATPAAETSGIANFYNSADMERRICKPLGFAGPFRLQDVPALSARLYLIGPIIAGEVDLPLLKAVAGRGPVALDVQGFVRVREEDPSAGSGLDPSAGSGLDPSAGSGLDPSAGSGLDPSAGSGPELVFRQWADMEEGLANVTYLKVDRAEAELLTSETDLSVAARRLADYGPREVVITQSSGVTVFADGTLYQAPFTPRSLAGRTGRGDTCFATYLGKRLSGSPQEATRFAAAVTTLKQERPGPWRGNLADVEELLKDA
jgi:sugar/nucleoside kinase (ribokinase family)